jgi:hypothetical protein
MAGICASASMLAILMSSVGLLADEIAVPVALQVELMVKVAAYDNNLPSRAGDKVRVLVVTRAGSGDSSRAAAEVTGALAGKATIAGLPHEESAVSYGDAAALARACRSGRTAIVDLTPGFSDAEIGDVARALEGVDVLSVSAVPGYVPRGIVLGFDLVSGKPKLLVHLTQARKQRVALSADVLKLMKVYE